MADKMYYSEEEAIQKLGLTQQQLEGLVSEGKIRAYHDGVKRMFKADEVDALAPAGADKGGEVELTPAEESTEDVITLSEAEEITAAPGKADTVITSEGISIFDEEDLEVAADPMAKTTIAPSMEDQISLEGVGSGSGLLDLTRESDDTSLGAEVLEHIDVESAIPSSAAVEGLAAPSAQPETEPVFAETQAAVEQIDAGSGAFSGMIVAACLLMIVMGAVVMAIMLGAVPPYLETLQNNWPAFIAIAAIVTMILAGVGYFLGKSIADQTASLRRSGG
ncbi:MAG: hypothetical protein KAV00_16965 [Phycisphaerae bacterium]|nr:hypothetical protein [Phycisphaerae bacterium]